MTEKQAHQIISMLKNCQTALYQLDKIAVFLLSCLLALVVLYSIWYILVRFVRF